MTSREGKDTPQQLERRKQKSKDVEIQFINPFDYNVLDEEGNVKYVCHIDPDSPDMDECTCASFLYGMKYDMVTDDSLKGESRFVAENGFAFQCKHLIKGRKSLGIVLV